MDNQLFNIICINSGINVALINKKQNVFSVALTPVKIPH